MPGDLLAALLLGWSHRHPDDLATAIEKAVAGLQQVLKGTVADCPPELLMRRDRSAEVCMCVYGHMGLGRRAVAGRKHSTCSC